MYFEMVASFKPRLIIVQVTFSVEFCPVFELVRFKQTCKRWYLLSTEKKLRHSPQTRSILWKEPANKHYVMDCT